MTQKSAKKRDTRARQARFGGKYNAHFRQGSGPEADGLSQLLEELGTTEAFAVLVTRHAARSGEPAWIAETGALTKNIQPDEYSLLSRSGAAVNEHMQVHRSYRDEAEFSGTCRKCEAYLSLGQAPHEGICACGQRYRVVFDLAETLHGSLEDGCRCMSCGYWKDLTAPNDGSFPWHRVNEWQERCHRCFVKNASERERRVAVMVRRRKQDVQFVHLNIQLARDHGAESFRPLIAEAEESLAALEVEYERVLAEVKDGRDDSTDQQLSLAVKRVSRGQAALVRHLEVLRKARPPISDEVEEIEKEWDPIEWGMTVFKTHLPAYLAASEERRLEILKTIEEAERGRVRIVADDTFPGGQWNLKWPPSTRQALMALWRTPNPRNVS